MLPLQQRLLAILILVSNSLVFAGSMGCDNGACAPSPWKFAALALYLQPSYDGDALGYAAFTNYGFDALGSDLEVSGASNRIKNIRPQWAFGFELESAYYFSPEKDITANWYHLHDNTKKQFPSGNVFAGPAAGLYAGLLKIQQNWDAVTLSIGQQMPWRDQFTLRFYAGAQFATISNTFRNYPKLLPNASPLFVTEDQTSFKGFGPRLGGDFAYAISNGFMIYAKPAAGLLLGTSKQRVTGYYDFINSFGTTFYSISNFTQSNSNVVVPELETKLGISYLYAWTRCQLLFDLGYVWQTYLQSLVNYSAIGYPGSSTGVPNTSNFSLNGLYFGMKWLG